MKKMKIGAFICLSVVLIFTVYHSDAQSRTKIYYSGEATTFRDKLIFATVNTGALELFTLENKQIVRTANFKPKFVRLPKGSDGFHDLQFDINDGSLYLYLTNGSYLYKYDISDPYSPKLLEKIRDNTWDWFLQLDKIDGYLVTVGTKGVKYWNKNLQVVNSYKPNYQKAENVSFSSKGDFIFSLIDNTVEIYDTERRDVRARIWLSVKEDSIRGVYGDSVKNEIYVVDDKALRVFDLDGLELRKFDHPGGYGYDVESSGVSNAVYFSGGVGVVKNDKDTLKSIDWKYTTDIASGGAWAMDIAVTSDSSGDKVVVFNKYEILVLDKNLELIDFFKASDIDEAPIESLYIKTDKRNGFVGDYLTVSGGGFAMNEDIVVKMGKEKWSTSADSNGRFKRTITIVDMKPQITDIKVDGQQSELSYSTSFKIN